MDELKRSDAINWIKKLSKYGYYYDKPEFLIIPDEYQSFVCDEYKNFGEVIEFLQHIFQIKEEELNG